MTATGARAGAAAAVLICLGTVSAAEQALSERSSTDRPSAEQPAGARHPVLAIHLNQVALERLGPKSAIVEYGGDRKSGHYRILKDGILKDGILKDGVLKEGAAVRSGALSALPQFSEWNGARQYFEADFSSLQSNGTYTLEVAIGEDTARSAPFRVADNATFTATADAVLKYFKANRHTDPADHRIRIYGTDRFVDVWGGWKDAGGDNGKYLSHLSYANFFNPQQTAFVAWALAKAYDTAPALYAQAGLDKRLAEEVLWGADHLHRLLDPQGFFYLTVFDRWGTPGAERVVTGYEGIDGVYTSNYQAAFREGAGVAIAALARAAALAERTGARGKFSAAQYLRAATSGFAHLEENNRRYCDDGKENIIDDYTALLAATELHRATGEAAYLESARRRAARLNERLTAQGWFVSDDGNRPYYHGADAGFPVLSLVYYLDIERDADRVARTRDTIHRALEYQLALNGEVANPFNYARQVFRTYKDGKPAERIASGFFMPHANETGYWWQGESARLSSLAAAAILGGRLVAHDPRGAFGVREPLAEFAQNQLDWTLGRNPFDLCLLYGFGVRNPPSAQSAGDMVVGGISNGITGATLSDEGRGIVFAEGPDENNWRWIEQWLPHSTWFLLTATIMAGAEQPPPR